jgi:hypoxanthine phosphoribosyltransferase
MSTSPRTDPPTPARVLIDRDELRAGVRRLGRQLSETYDDGVVLVPVLKGSLLFVADLVRSMTVDPTVDFLAITTYAQGTGRVRLVKDLDGDVAGRDVVLVEDIVDTGLTLAFLLGELGRRGPASLQVCTLLDRPAGRILPSPLRFVGFEIPDEFVIGYGLDYAGRYRNLDLVAAADPAILRSDPDAYVAQLYPEPPPAPPASGG